MVKIRGIRVDVKTGKKEVVEEEIPDEEYQKRLQEAEKARQQEERERLINEEMQKILREQAIGRLKQKGLL